MVSRPVVALAAAALASLLAGCSLAALPASPNRSAGGGAPTTTPPPANGSGATPTTDPAPTPTTISTPTPTTTPTPTSGFVTSVGTQLLLNGHRYQPVSVNAYELATDWGVNAGCGAMLDDAALRSFFGGLPSGATVRIWGFQGSMATNVTTGARDWGPLDRVVSAAAAAGDHLIVSLGNEWGVCDDGVYKDLSWYLTGYRDVAAGNGYDIPTESYWNWVQDIVSRYAGSTTIAMWELINEPEAPQCAPGYASPCAGHLVCNETAAATALRSFYDVVGAKVKHLDPNHLLESGSGGGAQCGWAGGDYTTVSASAGIDVASFHDYEGGVLPADFEERLPQAAALEKPLLVGELGLEAGDVPGCASLSARATQASAKIDAMLGAGAAGVFFWDWVPSPQTSACTLDVGDGDPIMTLLRT